MSSDSPTALVVGAGPGVSGSLARLLAAEGYRVGLLGREPDVLADLATDLAPDRASAGDDVPREVADLTHVEDASAALQSLCSRLGRVDLLHFNPSAYRPHDPLTLTAAELAQDVALGVGALLTTVQACRGHLHPGARITATGSAAADRPDPSAASLGVQKAGLRNLVLSLDRRLADDGIRAVCVTVDGVLAPKDPDSPFHPDQVARALLDAARRPEEHWTPEVHHRG